MDTKLRSILKRFRCGARFLIVALLTINFIFPKTVWAQGANLSLPSTLVLSIGENQPLMMVGVRFHPENPLLFDFIFNKDDSALEGEAFLKESRRVIKYFLAALTIPAENFWVNLSPVEPDEIIESDLGQTETGRDLLEQDYLLKQLAASLGYPEGELGGEFQQQINDRVWERFGQNVTLQDTFHKVWITAKTAEVWDRGTSAFVLDSQMQVLLEEDYVAEEKSGSLKQGVASLQGSDLDQEIREISSEVMREILIPEIEREVNQGQLFSNLRQVYNTVILAEWYKRHFKQSLLGQVYVGKSKIGGMDLDDKETSTKIYSRYMESLRKGVYNYIREDQDLMTGEVLPRKYFAGGVDRAMGVDQKIRETRNPSQVVIRSLMQEPDKVYVRVQFVETDLDDMANKLPEDVSEDASDIRGLGEKEIMHIVARSLKYLINPQTGIPYDHFTTGVLEGDQILEVGRYSSPSKWSVFVSVLLGIIEGKVETGDEGLGVKWARDTLEKFLITDKKFIDEHKEFGGISGWGDDMQGKWMSDSKIEFLDMGLFVWALQGVVGGLMDSKNPQDQKIIRLAKDILKQADFSKFYDPQEGVLYGALEYKEGAWTPQKDYVVQDFNEHIAGVLFAVLHNQIPRSVWDNLPLEVLEDSLSDGRNVTRFKGYKGAMHEIWPLLYLNGPIMRSGLAPLFKNFLYAQTDFARSHGLPGLLAPGYTSRGYQVFGINQSEGPHYAVLYATAMASLIDREAGIVWLRNFFKYPGMITPLGPRESVGEDGRSTVISADAVFMTLAAMSGGFSAEVDRYLSSNRLPGTNRTMSEELDDLIEQKHVQVMTLRNQAPLATSHAAYFVPSDHQIKAIQHELPKVESTRLEVSPHLQAGYIYAENAHSFGSKILKGDDIGQDNPFSFIVDIPKEADRAWRGTFISPSQRIYEMKHLTFSFPKNTRKNGLRLNVQLKSDGLSLVNSYMDLSDVKGVLSADGQWQRITVPIEVSEDGKFYAFNFFSVEILQEGPFESEVSIKDVVLSEQAPSSVVAALVVQKASDSQSPLSYNDVEKRSLGGIDFNGVNLDLKIKHDKNGVPLPVEWQSIKGMEVNGIVPVILGVAPINFPMMLRDDF